MRWIPFLILVYAVVLFQCTIGKLLAFDWPVVSNVGPDFLAILAVYVALNVRSGSDAILAGWLLGLAVDLTSAGAGGAVTVVGPMALAYSIGAGLIFKVREAFFREHTLTRAFLTLLFCILVHWIWITAQSLIAGNVSWSSYSLLFMQLLVLALYTAVLAPLGYIGLSKIRRWIFSSSPGRAGRSRR